MIIKSAKKWLATVVSVCAAEWKFFTLLLIVSFIVSFLWIRHDAREKRIRRDLRIHEQILEDEREAKAEAQHRNAEKTALAPTAPLIRPTPETETETEPPPGVGMSVEVKDGVEVVTSGPLKGMTLEEAKAAEMQRRAETLAAAEKRWEWERRRDALKKRYLENSRKLRASARATLASADAELDAMLSLFKLMSPEQLEYAREEALKTLPAEKVEAFFDALANHGNAKTPEQLTKDAQDILKSREARRIADREIEVESQQIALEEEELRRTEPPIPWE